MTTIGRILGWSRPRGEQHHHAVIAQQASVITACRGRWSANAPSEFLDGRDRDVDHAGRALDKCIACDLEARLERTRDGLRELAAAVHR